MDQNEDKESVEVNRSLVGIAGFYLLSAALAFPLGFVCNLVGIIAFAFRGTGNPQQSALIILLDIIIVPAAAFLSSPLQAYMYEKSAYGSRPSNSIRLIALSSALFAAFASIALYSLPLYFSIDARSVPPLYEFVIMGANYGVIYGLFTSTIFIIIDRKGCAQAVSVFYLIPFVMFWLFIFYGIVAPAFLRSF